jgi:predicted nuclease of predicted toxin-antitoxin system
MARFLIDESLPRLLSELLRESGHESRHALELGLKGKNDAQVFAAAQRLSSAVVSRDNDFSNLLRFPLGGHCGIVVVRYPSETRISRVATDTERALAALPEWEFAGSLIIVEPGRVRVRRPG